MKKRDDAYWERKIRFYLHDPMDKALKIQGHEERARKIAAAFGVSTPDKSEVALADILASGLDRASLAGHSRDESQKGSIDFAAYPHITHPVSGGDALPFAGGFDSAESTTNQIVRLIETDTNRLDRIWRKQDYFHYLFFILRKRIVAENCGKLGHLWNLLPADSRIPDHSIWTHAGMVSALGTALAESETKSASMVVFSLSPVQSFINKTRKLKDHWAASVILSWLCFEGIAAVMENLGPDHVLYPSLQGQPLIEDYLMGTFHDLFAMEKPGNDSKQDNGVASLPNKFVFIAPTGAEEEIVNNIESRIHQKWRKLADIVLEFISAKNTQAESIFNRQTVNWWRFTWSASHLITINDQKDMACLFGESKFAGLFETIKKFSASYPSANIAYPATHTLVQTALAASKTLPKNVRAPEPGIKCPVCGELEVLHDFAGQSANRYPEYKTATDNFWKKLSRRFGESTVREKEKLCAICSIKRFAVSAIERTEQPHPLKIIFKDGKFPSTTAMATWEYRNKLRQAGLLTDPDMEQKLIDELHETPDKYSKEIKELLHQAKEKGLKKNNEEDNYYAILMMDGDNMGDLVNGTSIPAKWRDVLHPELVSLYEKGVLQAKWPLWKEYLEKQRILSPGLHVALSESLGAFSLFAVPAIIQSCDGKLIYAGGDDMAAILPLSKAIVAAQRIQEAFNTRFADITTNGVEDVKDVIDGSKRIFLFPGNGNGVSISASLLICHHKQPLRGALEESHRVLNQIAKKHIGKNAFAIRLKKRSGQARDFTAQWNKINPFFDDKKYTLLSSFRKIQEAYNEELLSGSLIYRVPDLSVMMRSILPDSGDLQEREKKKIIQIFSYEIGHSGSLQTKYPGEKNQRKRDRIARDLAAHIAGISIRWDENTGKNGEWEFNGEAAVIARYLARGGDQG